ncbi:hypothetical protein GJ697_22215 [Pseudoduganella sp. FT25W]|uniref:Uncharacterized protein n=1 Tax=Duganella alba TaxID=2666081 RepID=A0A6L5QLC4_9BURK|nr:hypothetical protein [Duganella alba]MRX10550.1 hypothetical protein [Duganella alba]MRX18170.1 hypothetical protein [Duganella alba]
MAFFFSLFTKMRDTVLRRDKRRYTLNHSVRLPADVLVALGEHTGLFWSSWELEPIICDAIRA